MLLSPGGIALLLGTAIAVLMAWGFYYSVLLPNMSDARLERWQFLAIYLLFHVGKDVLAITVIMAGLLSRIEKLSLQIHIEDDTVERIRGRRS